MADYDVRKLHYSELVRMAEALRACGALADRDYLEVIRPSSPFALVGDAEPDPTWSRPRDMLDHFERQIRIQTALGMDARFIERSRQLRRLFEVLLQLQPAARPGPARPQALTPSGSGRSSAPGAASAGASASRSSAAPPGRW